MARKLQTHPETEQARQSRKHYQQAAPKLAAQQEVGAPPTPPNDLADPLQAEKSQQHYENDRKKGNK